MKIIPYFFVTLLFLITISCTTDSISDLIEIDETPEITYQLNIKSIIDNNCISCHATVPVNGAPMSLTTYENVKDAVLNRGLLDRISRAEGTSGAMPFGGPRLPQNQINLIVQWSEEGFAE